MKTYQIAWICVLGGMTLVYLVLRHVRNSPDLLARWQSGDRLRTWFFLSALALPAIGLLVWKGPKLLEGPGPVPAKASWVSELRETDRDAGGEQQQLERELVLQVAAALEDGLGAEHFRVMVQADVKEHDLQSLVLDLVIDENVLSFDSAAETYSVSSRSRDNIEAALERAKTAAGFNALRGDRASLITLPFDSARLVTEDISHRDRVEKEATTDKTLIVAKILGIVAALITIRWVVRSMERSMGLGEGGSGCGCC